MDGAISPPRVAPWSGEQVRFMTAGSVDDGKSTLIGRLLLDSNALMRDQASALGEGDDLDLAALTDGLEAERAQGITIDVAYRYFATPAASFIIADAPGHEQYTRNMVTAASVSDVAVLVIDAGRFDGALKTQTLRHAAIIGLMGLDLIVAINKMDAVGWSIDRFEDIRAAFRDAAPSLSLSNVTYIPVSAKRGDNVVHRGAATWWAGPTLVEALEQARPRATAASGRFRLPVQTVLRDGDRRFYAGRIEAGAARVGDAVLVGPSGSIAKIKSVSVSGRAVNDAAAGDSVALELDRERDATRGDVITDANAQYSRSVVADLCWLDEAAWTPGRRYRLRQGTLETQARIETGVQVRDVSDFTRHVDASGLGLNDVARVRVTTRDPILADLYTDIAALGAFVLFDAESNQTCAAGMLREVGP